MQISHEKTKLMTNNTNDIQREIMVKGQKLGTLTSLRYLGERPEFVSRITQATAALRKLVPILRDNNMSLLSNVNCKHT